MCGTQISWVLESAVQRSHIQLQVAHCTPPLYGKEPEAQFKVLTALAGQWRPQNINTTLIWKGKVLFIYVTH